MSTEVNMEDFGVEIYDYVHNCVVWLVDDPDAIEIQKSCTQNIVVLEIMVSKRDVGKVIGKQGRNVDAIRILAGALAAKYKQRVIISVLDK